MVAKSRKWFVFLLIAAVAVAMIPTGAPAMAKTAKMRHFYRDGYEKKGMELSKNYSFGATTFYNDGTGAAYIVTVKNGYKEFVAHKNLKNSDMMYYVGKYGKKYYFNLIGNYAMWGKAIYSFTPGKKGFKREKKGLALDSFKKYGDWTTGVKIGRYVTAAKNFPTDPSPIPKVYIYDLKKKKKRTLDKNVAATKRIGKKIYYVKAPIKRGKMTKLIVRECKANGKGKKTVKTIYLPSNVDFVWVSSMGKHYIKYTTPSNDVTKKVKYR